jgi:glucose-6-phosphate 1-dehydrogenase
MKYFVLLGASGDLAKTKLFPALFENYKEDLKYKYIGYGRTQLFNTDFRKSVKDSIGENAKEFLSNFSYIQGEYKANDLAKLKNEIDPKETTFYLAIPNRFNIVNKLIEGLKENELIQNGTTLVLEKPFGEDYNSAKQLTDFLKREIGEEKIYPIDHYLAKNLVRNLITLRFANPVFENLWSNKYIKKIDIDIKENEGIKNRGEYYDKTGAIKDMIQNHGLQLLSLITFNQPKSFKSEDFHKEKEDVLSNLKVFNDKFDENIKIGQYKEYLRGEYINEESKTETYASINFEVNNERWKGVPIKLTTGKKLDEKRTEVKIYFTTFEDCLWQGKCETVTENILTINIFPENNIKLSVNTEFKPDLQLPKTKELRFDFSRDELLDLAYSNALRDIYNKEKSYTPSFNEILLSWSIVDEIEEWLDKRRDNILEYY